MAKLNRVITILLAILSFSSIAVAQEDLVHNGEPGVWFPSEVANDMLADVEDYRLIQPEIALLKDRLQIRADRIVLLKEQVSVSKEAADKAESVLSAAVKQEREAREELDAWYRSPILWVSAGIVVTIGLEIAAVYLFESVAN